LYPERLGAALAGMSSAEIGETVRELENLVRQIVVLNTGGAIGWGRITVCARW